MDQLVNYSIVNFHKENGVLEIFIEEMNDTISIEVPIVNGRYIDDEELLEYIKGFIPWHSIQRKKEIAKGVENEDDFLKHVNKTANEDTLAAHIRKLRDTYLLQTDYLVLPDATNTPEAIERFKVYRQQLRDVPQQPGFPYDITWPTCEGEWLNHKEAKTYDDFISED